MFHTKLSQKALTCDMMIILNMQKEQNQGYVGWFWWWLSSSWKLYVLQLQEDSLIAEGVKGWGSWVHNSEKMQNVHYRTTSYCHYHPLSISLVNKRNICPSKQTHVQSLYSRQVQVYYAMFWCVQRPYSIRHRACLNVPFCWDALINLGAALT